MSSANKNKAIEFCVSEFVEILKSAGSVDGRIAKPSEKNVFHRGIIPKQSTKKEIYISFKVTDCLTNTASDNGTLVHDVYIDFVAYSRKGFDNKNFVDFLNDLSEKAHKQDFFVDPGMETTHIEGDTEVVICGKPITVNKLIILEE